MPLDYRDQRLGLRRWTFITILGISVCAVTFAFVGSLSEQTKIGAWAGSVIGLILVCGHAAGLIGMRSIRIGASAILGAILGAWLGPGVDVDVATSGPFGTLVGAFLGATGWRGFVLIAAAVAGLNLIPLFGGPGFLAGLLFTTLIALLLFKKEPSVDEVDLCDNPRPTSSNRRNDAN